MQLAFTWYMTVRGNTRCGTEFGESLADVATRIQGSGVGVEGVYVYHPGHPEFGEIRTGVHILPGQEATPVPALDHLYVYSAGDRPDGFTTAVGAGYADNTVNGAYALFADRDAAIAFVQAEGSRTGCKVFTLSSVIG